MQWDIDFFSVLYKIFYEISSNLIIFFLNIIYHISLCSSNLLHLFMLNGKAKCVIPFDYNNHRYF